METFNNDDYKYSDNLFNMFIKQTLKLVFKNWYGNKPFWFC